MNDDSTTDDLEFLRLERAAAREPFSRESEGSRVIVGRVTTATASIAVGKYLLVNPVNILGTEVEGGTATLTVGTGSVPVYLVGPGTPKQGDDLICRRLGHRWAADFDGATTVAGGDLVLAFGNACSSVSGVGGHLTAAPSDSVRLYVTVIDSAGTSMTASPSGGGGLGATTFPGLAAGPFTATWTSSSTIYAPTGSYSGVIDPVTPLTYTVRRDRIQTWTMRHQALSGFGSDTVNPYHISVTGPSGYTWSGTLPATGTVDMGPIGFTDSTVGDYVMTCTHVDTYADEFEDRGEASTMKIYSLTCISTQTGVFSQTWQYDPTSNSIT